MEEQKPEKAPEAPQPPRWKHKAKKAAKWTSGVGSAGSFISLVTMYPKECGHLLSRAAESPSSFKLAALAIGVAFLFRLSKMERKMDKSNENQEANNLILERVLGALEAGNHRMTSLEDEQKKIKAHIGLS